LGGKGYRARTGRAVFLAHPRGKARREITGLGGRKT
jgi:hypothetical protein